MTAPRMRRQLEESERLKRKTDRAKTKATFIKILFKLQKA